MPGAAVTPNEERHMSSTDPWASGGTTTPEPIEFAATDDGHEYSWEELAGPFCSCGDFGCPGGTQPQDCSERSVDTGGFYPEHWTDEDIDNYEFSYALDSARWDNRQDAERAAQRLNELAAEDALS